MTGWRCGFAVGSAFAIEALGRVKTNIDSGIFNAIQLAGIAALEGPQDFLIGLRELYAKRRDLVVDTFNDMGWTLEPPKGSIYVWLPVPEGHDSASFATLLLEEAGVVVPPGRGYGPAGEGFIRISLTVNDAAAGGRPGADPQGAGMTPVDPDAAAAAAGASPSSHPNCRRCGSSGPCSSVRRGGATRRSAESSLEELAATDRHRRRRSRSHPDASPRHAGPGDVPREGQGAGGPRHRPGRAGRHGDRRRGALAGRSSGTSRRSSGARSSTAPR